MRSAAGFGAAAILFAGVLLVGVPASVLAHAELVASAPADGEELPTPPTELRLVFTEAPRPEAVSVRLFDRHGNELDLGEPGIDPRLATTVTVPIATKLRPGPYTIVWKVVSEDDEHPVSRELVFGVEEPPQSPSVTADELGNFAGGDLGLAARFLSLLGLVLIVGSAVQAAWFSLPATRMAVVAAGGGFVVTVGLVLDAVARATTGAVRQGPLASFDPATGLGFLLASFVVVAAVIVTRQPERRGRPAWLFVLIAAVGLAWIVASKSHAAGAGILLWVGVTWSSIDLAIARPELYPVFPVLFELARQLNVAVATVHVLAVAAWIGGLLAAGIANLAPEQVAEWHPRFSRFALRAFVVVAVTGLYQAVLYLSSPQAVVETDYGLMLLGKHVFVAGVLGLAAVNRFVLAPALRRGAAVAVPGRAVAVVRTEAALGIVVTGAAVLLTTTPPARPPTDIFLEPDVVSAFGQQRQMISGDRGGWQLAVSQRSSTTHRFELHGPVAVVPDTRLQLEGPDGSPERDLTLQQTRDAPTGEGLVLTRDGRWSASVATPGRDEVEFVFDVRGGRVLPHDEYARSLWDRAIRRTETGMDSARMVDALTDGVSLMLFAHHELAAPDRERFEILGGREHVTIAGKRFARQPGGGWEVQSMGRAFSWPDYSFLEAAIGVVVVGATKQAALDMTVLAGYDPVSLVAYEIWVGRQDGLIHRLVMGLPGHYMVNAYYDVNRRVRIEPPVSGVPSFGSAARDVIAIARMSAPLLLRKHPLDSMSTG